MLDMKLLGQYMFLSQRAKFIAHIRNLTNPLTIKQINDLLDKMIIQLIIDNIECKIGNSWMEDSKECYYNLKYFFALPSTIDEIERKKEQSAGNGTKAMVAT